MESGKEIKCPFCNQSISLQDDSEIIKCNNCNKILLYKNCLLCNHIIFFNSINYDCYNIQCPYISCGGSFCLIKCENKECKSIISYKNKVFQGDKIKCSKCKIHFKKVKCPDRDCEKYITFDLNFFEGNSILCKHKSGDFIFQKVGCWYCGRHCIWNNSKGKYYIEGQMIICPYKECERITNKVKCPKCLNSSIITRGNLDMGKKIGCTMKGCDNVYNIYFCPYCKKTNYGNGSPICGKNLICNFCHNSFCFVNCLYCKQIHFWKNKNNYLPCQTIYCANEGCRKKTALIPCSFCQKINYFSNGTFILGQKYTCSYRECKNEFVILYCWRCHMTHIKKGNLDLKALYTCDNCMNIMPTLQCPKCFKFCSLERDEQIETHSMFKCPYEKCGINCYYYICPFCKRDFYNNCYENFNIKCPFKDCNKIYNYFKCKKCLKDNFLENIDNNQMNVEEINCLYCNESNEVCDQSNNNKILKIKKVDVYKGEKYDFDNPEEDPYDRLIINSLIHTNNYEIPFAEENSIIEKNENHVKMCVVCLSNEIKWILVPCGHKCVCEDCGKIILEKNQNCPICKQKIIGKLVNIYDD